jgi:hypothetical protein
VESREKGDKRMKERNKAMKRKIKEEVKNHIRLFDIDYNINCGIN